MQDSGSKKKDRLLNNIPQEQFVCTRGGEPKVMKKVVNSVLASALALTVAPMVVGAEEATQTDTTKTEAPKMDAELQKVVNRLNALGVVQGYGDGDFKVDQTINRAEFATLITRIRGLEQGAKFAQYQSTFTDVNSSDWFAGFVNVASGQEIIKGFPDKSFKPKNDVTYAEAVTMLIRALGYEPSVKGVWPNNMIAKASELNIAKSITAPNNAATRGDIFKMIDNALRVKLMEQQDYGVNFNFQITDETLLTRYMKVKVRDMEWAKDEKNGAQDLPIVTNVPVIGLGTLKANEVSLNGKNARLGSSTYKVADGINPNEFAGQHVQVWIKDDKENTIVWMEGSEDEEVIMDRLGTFYFNDREIKNGNTDDIKKDSDLEDLEIELDGNGKTYRFNKDTKVTYNFKPYSDATKGIKDIIAANDGWTFSAKVVLDEKDEISYIHVIDDQTLNATKEGVKYGSKVIEKIDADKKKITNLNGGSFTKLADLDEGKDFLVFRDNKPAKLADLKPMDVYSVYYADGKKEKLLVFATSTVVEGKVDKVVIRSDSDNRLTIGDKTYRFRKGSTFSDNQNKDITVLEDGTWDKIRDLDGESVKLYLDASGRIRHIETGDNVSDRRFKAILTTKAELSRGKYEFSIIGQNGKKYDLALKPDKIYMKDGKSYEKNKKEDEILKDFVPNKNGDKILLLEVTLDAKGEAEKVKVLPTNMKYLEGNAWDNKADEDDDMLDGYEVVSDTAIFDMTGEIRGTQSELKNPRIAKFSNIAKKKDLKVYYSINEDEEVDAIFVIEGDGLGGDVKYGQVLDLSSAGDGYIKLITKDKDDKLTTVEYKLDGDYDDLLDAGIRRGDFIAYSLNTEDEVIVDDVVEVVDRADDIETADFFGDGKYKPATDEQLKSANLHELNVAQVTDVTSSRITYEYKDSKGEKQTQYFAVNSKTAYIDAGELEETDGVEEGDYIILVETDDDGNKYDYVLIVTNEDDFKREYTKEERETILKDFFAQANYDVKKPGDGDGEVKDILDEESLEAVVSTIFDDTIGKYVISGKGEKGATIKVTVGEFEKTATVANDGTFKVTVLGEPGATEYTIEATLEGQKSEKHTIKFDTK
ncbi:S-layer homology domain-containing protein [Brevibacillus borstelensis]|uniref:S-layer homology domain-containing protein n=1 Tax=Brevibacillus borstelensis TaxID=45462 RepID=UPI002E246B45|nr:S-layer homology domain-containing protein [Brevibacillus borstelensis]